MVQNGLKWFKMFQNGLKYFKMVQNGSKETNMGAEINSRVNTAQTF